MNFEDLEFAFWLHDSRYLDTQCAFNEYLNDIENAEVEKYYRENVKTLEDTYGYIADAIRGVEFGTTKSIGNMDKLKTKMNQRMQLEDMINSVMKDMEEMRRILNDSPEGTFYEEALAKSQSDMHYLNEYRKQLESQREEIIEFIQNNIIE